MSEMIKSRQPLEVIEYWLKVLKEECSLNKAEAWNVNAWKEQIDEGHGLTEIQEGKLMEMYEAHT